MIRYACSRILLIIPTLVVVIFIIFMILNITPGDPGRIMLGAEASEEAVQELNHELGADRPVLERFGDYLAGVFRFDFGESYRTREPVFNEIFAKFPTTLKLAVVSVIISGLIGIPLGIISAIREYSVLDYSFTVIALFLASVPGFFLALILILVFSLWLHLLPSNGIGSFKNFILPALTLSLPTAALLSRMMRTSMLETMRQDYIRTARSKGANKQRIILRHALKPALIPIITILGMNFAYLLGGALIIETVFGLPGIGGIIIKAVQMKDTPVVMAVAIFLAVLYKLIMLGVDIIQAMVDPQLKMRFK